ncbi:granulin b [Betta splendens]|uniref:Granulin b n=1 Tax=Betta splendens TaxID=158456 RepID=A0A6P7L906_BETSP|nr:granulin b [Betta splendens]
MEMTLQTGILFLVVLGLSSALICPDGGMCEDKNTCCKNTEGGYGCCPLPHAECCSDHLHCCYEGTLCDLVHGKCVNKTSSLPWMRRRPSQRVPHENAQAVICPDQSSECPDDTTCCLVPDGSWGCCPLPNAVCCEDKHHCCPQGTKCDVAHSKCVSSSLESVAMLVKLPAWRRDNEPTSTSSSVMCPGGRSRCPDGFTCCQLTGGDYGCCPYPQAVCCSDHLHCCPGSSTCDLEHQVCKSGEARLPLLRKIPAVPKDVVCEDKKSICPDQTTCCKLVDGSYGCCPMPNAVCCSDHSHCCPAGTQSDLSHGTCVSAQGESPMVPKTPAAAAVMETVETRSRVGSVPCNDSVACANRNTCCKNPAGEWACCPLPKAVCCEDHLHCCPHGTVCNLAASTCDDPADGAVLPWLDKAPAFPFLSENSKCDESSSCPGESTCCRTAAGAWACCPLPQAVCCDDHTHCCPHGTVCNLEAETCDSLSSPSLPWVRKVPALTSELQDEKCDQRSSCPGGSTCCRRDSGQWACCPLPQAVCCSDREHCCPKGYECNAAARTCDRPGGPGLPWLQKVPALQEDHNMCDSQTSCPKDTTCCFMSRTQEWGCCPLPNAVCCNDGNNCCPSGLTCEPHRSSCSKGPRVMAWLRQGATPGAPTDVKCDNKSSCATGTTCCKLPQGDWGCCPLVKAVCCADHEHCCPHDYTCNMETGTCEKKKHSLRQTSVVPSKRRDHRDVPCDRTGTFHCSQRQTCCKVSSSEWACCPSPRAVCCSGSRHCCPAGYACDLKAGGCTLEAPLTWDTGFQDREKDFVPGGL